MMGKLAHEKPVRHPSIDVHPNSYFRLCVSRSPCRPSPKSPATRPWCHVASPRSGGLGSDNDTFRGCDKERGLKGLRGRREREAAEMDADDTHHVQTT